MVKARKQSMALVLATRSAYEQLKDFNKVFPDCPAQEKMAKKMQVVVDMDLLGQFKSAQEVWYEQSSSDIDRVNDYYTDCDSGQRHVARYGSEWIPDALDITMVISAFYYYDARFRNDTTLSDMFLAAVNNGWNADQQGIPDNLKPDAFLSANRGKNENETSEDENEGFEKDGDEGSVPVMVNMERPEVPNEIFATDRDGGHSVTRRREYVPTQFPPLLEPWTEEMEYFASIEVWWNGREGKEQKCVPTTLSPVGELLPPMQFYTTVEENFVGGEPKRLDYLSFREDRKEKWILTTDLSLFPEGIHGLRFGINLPVHDRVLFEMLSDLRVFYRTDIESHRLYATLSYLFPLKATVSEMPELEFRLFVKYMDAKPLPDLPDSFQFKPGKLWIPPTRVRPPVLRVRRRKNLTRPCEFCREGIFCVGHDPIERENASLEMHYEWWELVPVESPCGEDCCLHMMKKYDQNKVPQLHKAGARKWEDDVVDTLIESLLRAGVLLCDVGLQVSYARKEQLSCLEVFEIAQRLAPKPIVFRERILQQPKLPEHEDGPRRIPKMSIATKKHLEGENLRFGTPLPCSHPGACMKSACYCAANGLPCTMRCMCRSTCRNRPYCKCKGTCATKQCSCFSFNTECVPGRCTPCMSDKSHQAKSGGCGGCTNNQIQKNQQKRISVVPSHLRGWGCRLEEDVKKGDFIVEYCGELGSESEMERRGSYYDSIHKSYLYAISAMWTSDGTFAGNQAKFLNNSRKFANIEARYTITPDGRKRIGLYAKKDLKAGVELLLDYRYSEEKLKQLGFIELGDSDDSDSDEEQSDPKSAMTDETIDDDREDKENVLPVVHRSQRIMIEKIEDLGSEEDIRSEEDRGSGENLGSEEECNELSGSDDSTVAMMPKSKRMKYEGSAGIRRNRRRDQDEDADWVLYPKTQKRTTVVKKKKGPARKAGKKNGKETKKAKTEVSENGVPRSDQ